MYEEFDNFKTAKDKVKKVLMKRKKKNQLEQLILFLNIPNAKKQRTT